MRKYRDACHCGKGVFEIDTNLDSAAMCNCSICRPRNALKLYQFNTSTARHYFFSICGIYPFHCPRIAHDALTINVNCLDDVDDDRITNLEIVRVDGRAFPTSG